MKKKTLYVTRNECHTTWGNIGYNNADAEVPVHWAGQGCFRCIKILFRNRVTAVVLLYLSRSLPSNGLHATIYSSHKFKRKEQYWNSEIETRAAGRLLLFMSYMASSSTSKMEGDMFLRNIEHSLNYTALQPRKPQTIYMCLNNFLNSAQPNFGIMP